VLYESCKMQAFLTIYKEDLRVIEQKKSEGPRLGTIAIYDGEKINEMLKILGSKENVDRLQSLTYDERFKELYDSHTRKQIRRKLFDHFSITASSHASKTAMVNRYAAYERGLIKDYILTLNSAL
jgi:hypothetical protein